MGEYWLCSRCRKAFDTFEAGAVCPHCQAQFAKTSCFECGSAHAICDWGAAAGAAGQAAPLEASSQLSPSTD